ncbi:MAG: serine hydrolase [Pseudomonadales bacterium]|jgi:CubicO group peptidase (beta-lactamase class C family)|nr:serine hydrolase [Pseudomonadales bacterium]
MNKLYCYSTLLATLLLFELGLGYADSTERANKSLYSVAPRSVSSPDRAINIAKNPEPAQNIACTGCFSWDLDGSGKAEALTDGLLFMRYLFGFTQQALVNGALSSNATRTTSEEITAFLVEHRAQLDIDGNDTTDALSDGLLLIRYLFGFEGSSLINGALPGDTSRSVPEIISAFIMEQLPATQYDEPPQTELEWDLTPAMAEQVGTEQSAVDAIIDHIFTDIAVQSVLVTKDGFLIGQRYATGYHENSLGTSWSMAKSFYSAAIGAAIMAGEISSVDQKASEIITEWQGTIKADITLRQMLQMRSGYSASDEVFLFDDQTAYSIDRPLERPADTQFAYSNANSQLFEPIIRRTTGLSAHDYLSQKILTPIGIDVSGVGLWFDASGLNPMTYCCIDMKPLDFARFGLLYAREGKWRDAQIVPSDYVNSSLTANGWYGYQWWILNSVYFFGASVPMVIVAAQGLDGQYIFIWPEEDIVIVVLTQYSHPIEQGYVVDLSSTPLNYPDTCTARNSCTYSIGDPHNTFTHLRLVELMVPLADSP